ncbi:MAG TPA: V-type ATP synthase subunit E [Anaerohalosphaeraceae bacterium]|jgi:V/A-type H+-transporting ATPase subunit E|nr:V-type ATP synthase subunit E [Anaerohalosphaeraceae bacterium]HRT50786.1 V-type ATP synthase subunit E [Anaerohalosphaeraceae bacterium]HRT86822.1 V-type ATP synthase subunit E [Anaerohalosphaeraceae bacterium]
MNAEQVVDKILAEARAEADAIKAESDRRCAEMKAELQKELDAYRSETNRLASEAASDKQSRMLASARMAVRKDILAAKRALLDGVQEEAARRIAAMPDEEYQKLMTALMMKAAETGDEEVVIGKNESRITEKLIKEVNRQLGPGYRGNLHLARDRADISGGFILRRGQVQINASIEVLIQRAREELEMELTNELFGE